MLPHSVMAIGVALAATFATDATASTLTVSARHAWGGPTTQEVSIAVGPGSAAMPASVYLLRQTGVSPGLARRTSDALTDVAGWPMPKLMKARSTSFSFERSFVAASRDGTVAVVDPGSLALTVIDGRSGERVWRHRLDRLGLPASPAVGDIAYDGNASGRLYVWDATSRGVLRFSAAGRFLGLVKLPTSKPVLRMDVRGSRVALITGASPGSPRTVWTAPVTGGRPRALASAGGDRETAFDLDLDRAGRVHLLLKGRQGSRIDTLDPGTGAVADTAAIPIPAGLEFAPTPLFLDLGYDDRPVISDAVAVSSVTVTP